MCCILNVPVCVQLAATWESTWIPPAGMCMYGIVQLDDIWDIHASCVVTPLNDLFGINTSLS